MKKLIPFLVLLLGVSGVFAQGTVNFGNHQSDFTLPADRDVYMPDMMTPLVGTNFQARLLYGADANSLQPATAAGPARFLNVTTGASLAGTWRNSTRTLVGFAPGTSVMLMVQVWDAGPGAGRTYEEAAAQGGLIGQSRLYSYTSPAAGTLTPTSFYMQEFRSFELIPEPSVIGLGLIGIGALFMLRRRKA